MYKVYVQLDNNDMKFLILLNKYESRRRKYISELANNEYKFIPTNKAKIKSATRLNKVLQILLTGCLTHCT